jgi:prepilin signal peptidase PulO-like enzyme (type II secretory pathway)
MNIPLWSLLVFALAAIISGQINRAIYGLAWNQRIVGPWSAAAATSPARRWIDRIPIIGWWFLRRDSNRHGQRFWIRPLLIELSFSIGMVLLFAHEADGGLLPAGAGRVPSHVVVPKFASHLVLSALMLAATFIDIDEKSIPDSITIPGTLLGLLFAAGMPASQLPSWDVTDHIIPIKTTPLRLSSPSPWFPILDDWPGLAIGIFCLGGWCYGLLPKTLWYRGGVNRFFRYLMASIWRAPATKWLGGLLALLSILTVAVWWIGHDRWHSLLSSLVGMAASGAIVWTVRIVASPILGQEAMGFGDVTLMAMIGAFLGWQAGLAVFFVAPFTGVVIAIAQYVIAGRKDIAYGPFLCAATIIVLATWPAVWERCGLCLEVFGWWVPVGIAFSVVLLALMLVAWQGLKRLFFSRLACPHDRIG